VEGAGGLLSPLTWHHSTLDLALRLKADVVVVAADVLGTQNHVLLTLRVLQSADLAARAVILSAPACADASTGSNAAALARVIDVPIVSVPRTDTPEPHLVSLWAELSGPLSR
ncbi:MAG: dethiobiotin synthetase, partial [Myxococcota bacterium]